MEYMASTSMLDNIIHDRPSRGIDNTTTSIVTPAPLFIRKADMDSDGREGGSRGGGGSSIYSVPSYYTNLTDVDLSSPTFEIQKPKELYRTPSSRRF